MDYGLPTEFDLIVVGTGVVESIISAAASRIGKRVLHVDKNNYYGGHWASFNLEDIENLKNGTSVENLEECKNFIKDEESFIPLGNKLVQLLHFQSEWHVPMKDSAEISQNSEDKLQGEPDNQQPSNAEENSGGIRKATDNENAIDDIGFTKDADQPQHDVINEIKQLKITKEVVEPQSHVVTQESLRKDYRKFIIDLCPKLQFARGDFVDLLISSNIARYAEFRSVSRVLTWINGSIEVVPCSRSDVFANNKVSVVEKRMLMKLLTSIEADEKNLTVPDGTTYKELLKGKKLSSNITHFVLYALSMSTDETLWLDGIRNTKRFLNSLGRFGKTPFLFSMYGSGEITQAFCRLSAVFGGIFALNQPLHGIVLNKSNLFDGLICGSQRITASNIVMDVCMAPKNMIKNFDAKFISRAVFITDRSLMQSEKEHLTLLLYPGKNNKLYTILELGTLTGTCPKNLFLIHVTTRGHSNPKEELQDCVRDLFAIEGEDDTCRPKILWSSYFSVPDTNELDLKSCVPSNVFLCPGPDLDLDYDLSVKKAKEIFSSIYPNEEFLPRAPDADEIIIGDDPETETASEAKASSSDLDSSLETEKPAKQGDDPDISVKSDSIAEVAVEVRASCSDLDTSSEVDKTSKSEVDEGVVKEVEECSEAKENMQ